MPHLGQPSQLCGQTFCRPRSRGVRAAGVLRNGSVLCEFHVGDRMTKTRKRRKRRKRLRSHHVQQNFEERASRLKCSGRHARTRRRFAHKLQQKKKRKARRRKNKYLHLYEVWQKSTLKQLPKEAAVLSTSVGDKSKVPSTWRSIYQMNELRDQQEDKWVAASHSDTHLNQENVRVPEDGFLFTVPLKINGHQLTALIDSGASKSYIKQECVAPLGLDFVPMVSYLELADGTKLMSPGKCNNVHLYIGTILATVPLTVTKLLDDVHLILGTNYLEIFNPLIDWQSHQMWIQTEAGPICIKGTLHDSFQKTGKIRVLASMDDTTHFESDIFDLLKHDPTVQCVPDPRYALPSLPRPPPHSTMSGTTFLTPGASDIDSDDEDLVTPSKKIKRVRRVAGKRVVKTQSKEASQRRMVSSRAIGRAVKRGEAAFLAIVRPDMSMVNNRPTLASIGMTEGKKKQMSKQRGPRKEFATVHEVRKKVLEGIRPECRSELSKIFQEYADVFPEKLPRGKPADREVTHEIRIEEGSKPQSRPPYKLSPAERDEVEAQIADLLSQGFIRPSCSPYGAPVLFVPKKDGRWRMCIDYRALNKQTIKDRYPLPRVDELLDRLGGNKYFTKLDLASGYHQIAMKNNSVERTAFRTHMGHYEFLVMPFGLTNAPATFQRLMNSIFRGELGKFILVFLDDILIYSKTLHEHYKHIRIALDRLREVKLFGRLHKCDWVQDKVEYLGFDVSAEGVEPSKEKVKAVATWPRPTTIKDVRAFLGLASFYRRFIKNFSRIAKPLTDLTKDKSTGEWKDEQESAFLKLKAALVNAPILRLPDFSKPFTVTTDASQVALGAVLEQDFGNGNQPIAYASKKLNPTEMRYSAYERELLGIVWALGQWRQYLEHQKFVVQTDHSSLRYLPDQPAVNRRIWKWASILQAYKMEIKHIPGPKNPADSLTRRAWIKDKAEQEKLKSDEAAWVHKWRDVDLSSNEAIRAALEEMFKPKSTIETTVDNDRETLIEPLPVLMVGRTVTTLNDDLKMEIQNAVEIDEAYKMVLEELQKPGVQEWKTSEGVFKLRHGRLHFHSERKDYTRGQYWKLVIPANLGIRKKILKEIHSVPYSGHPGVQRTLIKLRESFYWKGMTRDVQEFVAQCPVCQTEKSDHRGQAGPLQPLLVPERKWQEVAIDFVTNLPLSSRLNDTIMTVVDRATKFTYFLPCKSTITAPQTARLFWRKVGSMHGIPSAIISDRDPRFTGAFWHELWNQFGTVLKMGSGYHPQSSGQVERYNQLLEQVLRVTIHSLPDEPDWEKILPTVHYVVNNTPNRHTGYTPFYLNFGYHPVTPVQLLSDNETKMESVESFVERLKKQFEEARKNLEHARETMMKQEHGHRRVQEFAIGDQVLLSTKNLNVKGFPRKLQRRFIGPFKVVQEISKVAYKVALPEGWKIHPVFHTSLLKLWQSGQWTEHVEGTIPEVLQDDEVVWDSEKLLRWRKTKVGNLVKREFLILWKDRPLEDTCWVSEDDFVDQDELREAIEKDKPVFVQG